MTASSRYVDPGCWLYVRLGVGHWLARGVPTQLNMVLMDWLETHRGRAPRWAAAC